MCSLSMMTLSFSTVYFSCVGKEQATFFFTSAISGTNSPALKLHEAELGSAFSQEMC